MCIYVYMCEYKSVGYGFVSSFINSILFLDAGPNMGNEIPVWAITFSMYLDVICLCYFYVI